MADITRVIIADEGARPIVTNADTWIGLFRPSLYTSDVATSEPEYAVYLGFLQAGGDHSGVVQANDLFMPAFPLQTVSLLATGDFELLGETIDASGIWHQPIFDDVSGTITPASLNQYNEFGDFQFQDSVDGDMRYIGYADADVARFGYIQIQRESLTQWKLIGHAYAGAGESLLVEDLTEYIPAPSTSVAIGILLVGHRSRRERIAKYLHH